MQPSVLDSIPWTEILTGIGALVLLLLQIGNTILKKILAETKNNGGSSLKDQIDRIESSIKHLAVWVEASQHLTTKPMFKADEAGRFTWVNLAFARMLGLGFEDLKGYGWLNYVHGEDVERVSREWAESIKDKRKFESIFKVKNSFDTNLKTVKARAFPVSLAQETLGFLGIWIVFEEVKEED